MVKYFDLCISGDKRDPFTQRADSKCTPSAVIEGRVLMQDLKIARYNFDVGVGTGESSRIRIQI